MANDKAQYQLPTVHSNGTGFKTLKECYDKADDALFDFIAAWEGIEFNARDYYVSGPEAWTKAIEQRQEMSSIIRAVREYIIAHQIHIHGAKR